MNGCRQHSSTEWEARPDAYRQEVERLYALPDRWLGEELLRLLDRALNKQEAGMGLSAVQAIQAIARRLGASAGKGGLFDEYLDDMDPETFRQHVADDLLLDRIGSGPEMDLSGEASLSAAALLMADPILGNPVVFALDRICPPPPKGQEGREILAWETRMMSHAHCDREFAAWTPDVQMKPEDEIDREGDYARKEELLERLISTMKEDEEPEDTERRHRKPNPEKYAPDRGEVVRMHGLPDRWLGEELLRLMRRVTHSDPTMSDDPVLTQMLPEIARRLGAKLRDGEHQGMHFLEMSPIEFRSASLRTCYSGNYLVSFPQGEVGKAAAALLERDHLHGNPIIIALDRICPPAPPTADGADWVAWDTRVRSAVYFQEQFSSWTPDCHPRSLDEITLDQERAILEDCVARLKVDRSLKGALMGIPIGERRPAEHLNVEAAPVERYIAKASAADDEMRRLYQLSDYQLAVELLELAERSYREKFHLYGRVSFHRELVLHAIPEIAHRLALRAAHLSLGGPEAEPAKRLADSIVLSEENSGEDEATLRKRIGQHLVDCIFLHAVDDYDDFEWNPSCASALLARRIYDGNPVAIALDRILPPRMDFSPRKDPLALHTVVIDSLYAKERFVRWHPDIELLSYHERDTDAWARSWRDAQDQYSALKGSLAGREWSPVP
jgi:hypothetical protein